MKCSSMDEQLSRQKYPGRTFLYHTCCISTILPVVQGSTTASSQGIAGFNVEDNVTCKMRLTERRGQ